MVGTLVTGSLGWNQVCVTIVVSKVSDYLFKQQSTKKNKTTERAKKIASINNKENQQEEEDKQTTTTTTTKISPRRHRLTMSSSIDKSN